VTGLVLFDFDGTLYRGDAPFRFYAEVIARYMDDKDRRHYLELVDAHLNGTAGIVAGDNWEAVVMLATPYLPNPDSLQEAFLETRVYMNDGDCPLEVAPELRQFLAEYRGRVKLACASNSPPEAAETLLKRLDLYDCFDQVFSSAGKPDGLLAVAQAAWDGPIVPEHTMSVGDNYKNDIAPAWEAGWATAHISPHGYFPGPSTVHGYTIEEILPFLKDWVDALQRSVG
jgi:FMN phosphatase YigB (HAD superfamily)